MASTTLLVLEGAWAFPCLCRPSADLQRLRGEGASRSALQREGAETDDLQPAGAPDLGCGT